MLFPSVALIAGFGAQGATGGADGVGVVPQINGPIWSFGPRAYWPLLDFGRLDALINIEEMRTHEALIRYKRTIIDAVEVVDQAIVQHHMNPQRRKALGAAQDEIHRAVVIARERYKRGEAELTALLDVERRHCATADRAAMAAEDAVLGYVAFYKAFGGGWELYDELPPGWARRLSPVARQSSTTLRPMVMGGSLTAGSADSGRSTPVRLSAAAKSGSASPRRPLMAHAASRRLRPSPRNPSAAAM